MSARSLLIRSPADLTRRQRLIVALIALGHNTKTIATLLGLSPKTVEFHRARTMQKLDLHSVAELTQLALRLGLVEIQV